MISKWKPALLLFLNHLLFLLIVTWSFFSTLFIPFLAIFWVSDYMFVVKIHNSSTPSPCSSLQALRWSLLINEVLTLKGRSICHLQCFDQIQVYPESWTAVYMPLDNVGMWNVRSENWARQYLGQQFYLRVYSPANSWRDEYPIPTNALLCGRAAGLWTRLV
jgi:hypothetical protein